MGRPVEDFCDGPEGLLASSIPDLQLEEFVFNFDATRAKVYSYGYIMLRVKSILRQSSQDT